MKKLNLFNLYFHFLLVIISFKSFSKGICPSNLEGAFDFQNGKGILIIEKGDKNSKNENIRISLLHFKLANMCFFESSVFKKTLQNITEHQNPQNFYNYYHCQNNRLYTEKSHNRFNILFPGYAYLTKTRVIDYYQKSKNNMIKVVTKNFNYFDLKSYQIDHPEFDVDILPPGYNQVSPGVLASEEQIEEGKMLLGNTQDLLNHFLNKHCPESKKMILEKFKSGEISQFTLSSPKFTPISTCQLPSDYFLKMKEEFDKIKSTECVKQTTSKAKISSLYGRICALNYLTGSTILDYFHKEHKEKCVK